MERTTSESARRQEARSGAASDPPVGSIMHHGAVTTNPQELLSAAQERMQSNNVRQLPVLEEGKLVGILSDRDLHAHSGYLERTKVDAAMTWDPITLPPETAASDAARLLLEKRLNAIPVVESERLVGIVSRSDLLRLLVGLLRGD